MIIPGPQHNRVEFYDQSSDHDSEPPKNGRYISIALGTIATLVVFSAKIQGVPSDHSKPIRPSMSCVGLQTLYPDSPLYPKGAVSVEKYVRLLVIDGPDAAVSDSIVLMNPAAIEIVGDASRLDPDGRPVLLPTSCVGESSKLQN